MLSIGAFAQLGQVTPRMLRHWHAEGLLVPAETDSASGYRAYDPSQLERLHRIVALRQLGMGLTEITLLLQHGIDSHQIASVLASRRLEIERDHRISQARLTDVERRLEQLREEHTMSPIEIIQKPLPALRLAAKSTKLAGRHEVSEYVGPTFDSIAAVIGHVKGALDTPVVQYDMVDDGLEVTVGYACSAAPNAAFDIVELPAVEIAVCGVHLGEMSGIAASWQAIHEEIAARRMSPTGPCRELYVRAESDDQADWVTELQQPVTSGAAG
ncbi:MerR family transcriptional regulator [Agrococcus casei]|uniref:MerR family transcriptional regulator n=1 Tax=Agrococcus casei TaxID=343512 RepID=UPI003F93E1A0